MAGQSRSSRQTGEHSDGGLGAASGVGPERPLEIIGFDHARQRGVMLVEGVTEQLPVAPADGSVTVRGAHPLVREAGEGRGARRPDADSRRTSSLSACVAGQEASGLFSYVR